MNFGAFVKEKRLEVNFSLRKFCTIAELDAGNWSKIERGHLSLAIDQSKLEELANILKFERDSENWVKFFDLAAVAKGKIPEHIYTDEEALAALPVFFRTASGKKPSNEELDSLISFIKERKHG